MKGADEGNLVALLRKERGERGKESFDRKTRCTSAKPNSTLNAG